MQSRHETCERLPVTATKDELIAAHKNKRLWKSQHRAQAWSPFKGVAANINWRTGKPHEHRAEITRRSAA